MPEKRPPRPTAWRGAPASAVGEEELQAELAEPRSDRVLVIVRHEGNRAHVVRQLRDRYSVILPGDSTLGAGAFDLAITDMAGLRDWWELLLDSKFQAEPTFLPVVLIVSQAELKRRARSYWDVVDEFVTTPVEPREFLERVSLLLRTRRLALAQRNHLAYVVNHDRVTGLPNSNVFIERIKDAIRDTSVLGTDAYVTVIHVPLTRVLKSFGHRGMNAIASRVSARLKALVGEEVALARLTTEEWGMVHRPGVKLHEVLTVINRARSMADTPFESVDEPVRLVPRIGVGVYPLDGSDAATVLDRAMAAQATATSSEPVFYSHDVQHAALRSIRTEARLLEALEGQQFQLCFQPQVDLRDKAIVAAEALVRWRLPSGEVVPPDQFLTVAEETGLIVRIDRWVLQKACSVLSEWRRIHLGVKRISVNVCAQDVREHDFVEFVRETLRKYELPPGCLELELTETDLIEVGGDNVEKLAILKAEGVRVAIDDFGTGYSSLGYLRSLPVTTLKIDRSFIQQITLDDRDAAIVEAVVGLAGRFGLETIAEGVESDEQMGSLRELEVDVVQGFIYSAAMSDDDLRAWVSDREKRDQE